MQRSEEPKRHFIFLQKSTFIGISSQKVSIFSQDIMRHSMISEAIMMLGRLRKEAGMKK
jgi:hypothetical protein